jgi:hypothetical protein
LERNLKIGGVDAESRKLLDKAVRVQLRDYRCR